MVNHGCVGLDGEGRRSVVDFALLTRLVEVVAEIEMEV